LVVIIDSCRPHRLIVDEALLDDNSGELSEVSIGSHLYLLCGASRDYQPHNLDGLRVVSRRHHSRSVRGANCVFTPLLPKCHWLRSGKKRRDIVLICLSLDDVEEGHVQMNKVARNNLHVKVGDSVYVYLHWVIKFCKYAHILPIDDSVEVLNKNLFDIYLKPYFRGGM